MADATSYSPGWYVVKTAAGDVGVVKHSGTGAISLGSQGAPTQAVLLSTNTSSSFEDLIANLGAKLNTALGTVGATAQQAAVVSQAIDVGAAKNSALHQLLVDPTGTQVTARKANGQSISDQSTGDANAGGVNVSISNPLSGFEDWVTTPGNWLRILEFVGGAAMILIAMKLLAEGS